MCRSVLHLKKMRSRLPRKNPSTSLRLVPLPLGKGGADFLGCGVRRGTWAPPYSRAFCRAGPVCPAGSTGKTWFGPMWASAPTKFSFHRCRGGRLCLPWPDNTTPCRAGPVCPAVGAVQNRRADVGIGPYGCVARGAMGGRPQGSPLRKRYKGGRGERNPPVTASPCQPPLGKGALRTGDADCHGRGAPSQ